MKSAIITGIFGQDGTYLSQYLYEKKYHIIGIDKIQPNFSKRLFQKNATVLNLDLSNTEMVFNLIKGIRPDYIYHLAAFHGSSEQDTGDAFDVYQKSYSTNVLTTANLLEGIKKYSNKTRLFYAGSSQMFGVANCRIQNERSSFSPITIYGITKCTATNLCRYYRKNHGIFASVGILYAHESPLRGSQFVSKKIVEAVIAIKKKKKKRLIIGNPEARVDWGYAGDYVKAMFKILQHRIPDDFIISSGITHKVSDFIKIAFDYLNLDWKKYIVVDNNVLKNNLKSGGAGDNRKLVSATGWKPETSFRDLVEMMVRSELEKHEN